MSPVRSRVPARRATRLLRTTGLGLGLVVLSAGCALQPGTAADVDGDRISTDEVDRIASAVCDVEGPGYPQPLPLASLKTLVLQTLVDERLAERVADEYDVEPGPELEQTQSQVATQVADQPEGVRTGYLEVLRAAGYSQGVLAAAAEAEVERNGGDPTDEQALAQAAEGIRSLAARAADIDISPRYGVTYVDGLPVPDEGGSVAASDSAVAAASAASGDGDPSYAQSLPADQVCGG